MSQTASSELAGSHDTPEDLELAQIVSDFQDALQKSQISLVAAPLPVHLEHPPCCPGMDGRVDVAERPFISRQLPIGVHVPFARQQQELAFGELRIH